MGSYDFRTNNAGESFWGIFICEYLLLFCRYGAETFYYNELAPGECEFELLYCVSMLLIEIETAEVGILFTPFIFPQDFREPLLPGYSSLTENDI